MTKQSISIDYFPDGNMLWATFGKIGRKGETFPIFLDEASCIYASRLQGINYGGFCQVVVAVGSDFDVPNIVSEVIFPSS